MRYLTRNKVYEKLEPNKDAKKIYIFCEGSDTEINYFKYFQGFSSNINIIPISSINGLTDPVKLKEQAELLFTGNASISSKLTLSSEYKDEVWFVIDTDEWNKGNKIQILKDFCDKKNAQTTQWYIAQSNPCFELWLYYHFYNTKPVVNEVEVFQSFKEYLNNKTGRGFDNRKMPIELELAIKNSLINFESENSQPKLYSTEVHNLGMVILPFVKTQLDKAKEMMRGNTIN